MIFIFGILTAVVAIAVWVAVSGRMPMPEPRNVDVDVTIPELPHPPPVQPPSLPDAPGQPPTTATLPAPQG